MPSKHDGEYIGLDIPFITCGNISLKLQHVLYIPSPGMNLSRFYYARLSVFGRIISFLYKKSLKAISQIIRL